jgi:hypothetical protein
VNQLIGFLLKPRKRQKRDEKCQLDCLKQILDRLSTGHVSSVCSGYSAKLDIRRGIARNGLK